MKPRPVTIERIDRALDTVAEVIDEFGDAYMPIFLRLERERDALAAEAADIDRVRQRLKTNRRRRTSRSPRFARA